MTIEDDIEDYDEFEKALFERLNKTDTDSDWNKLSRAFGKLASQGFYIQVGGCCHPCIWANDVPDEAENVVFFYSQTNYDEFDEHGNIEDELHIHWDGDLARIIAVFNEAKLNVSYVPKSIKRTIMLGA